MVPRWIKYALIVIGMLALIPPALIARARIVPKQHPRIHIIQNMDNQPKYVGQQPNLLFNDGRSMRPVVPGAIAQGDMVDDTHYAMGVVDGQWVTAFPERVKITTDFVLRGQERFEIYCMPCHGPTGVGDGIINQRAMQLLERGLPTGTTWVQAKNIHEPQIVEQPLGQVFNTITNGVRNMSGYGDQISIYDRWAIVSYIKALQESRNANPTTVPNADSLPRVVEQPAETSSGEATADQSDTDSETTP